MLAIDLVIEHARSFSAVLISVLCGMHCRIPVANMPGSCGKQRAAHDNSVLSVLFQQHVMQLCARKSARTLCSMHASVWTLIMFVILFTDLVLLIVFIPDVA